MKLTRRNFLKAGGALATAAHPFAITLAGLGEAAAQSAGTATDYKAIICVFLNGGNDHANTVVPFDTTSYNEYKRLRPDLAYQKNALKMGGGTTSNGTAVPVLDISFSPKQGGLPMTGILPLDQLVMNPATSIGTRAFALAPALTPLYSKFTSGRMGVLLNIGPLVKPITKAQYVTPTNIPPRLFSHNDQVSTWQSLGVEGKTYGWGGLIEDEVMSLNAIAPMSCVSIAGNTVFLAGQTAIQYQMGSAGPVSLVPTTSLFGVTGEGPALLQSIIEGGEDHMFEREHSVVMRRAIDSLALLSGALPNYANLFDDPKYAVLRNDPAAGNPNSLGAQLGMVAKMIASRDHLGAKRQVFFVAAGGWDMHSDLAALHSGQLRDVADALAAFDTLMQEQGWSESVTAFTGSDFGRTLTSNSGGSDHGWGSMHFVLGGAVKGGDFYGKPPVYGTDAADDVGSGRLLPTTSVEQLGATLAKWMGVTDPAALEGIFPNLANFPVKDLGFMRTT